MLWDLVKDEWAREKGGVTAQPQASPTPPEDDDIPEEEIYKNTGQTDESFSESSGDSDEDLLAELEGL
jgi:hypothetical protein